MLILNLTDGSTLATSLIHFRKLNNMTEEENIMKKHFVEEDSKKKTRKFNWPSIPVEANVYLRAEGVFSGTH